MKRLFLILFIFSFVSVSSATEKRILTSDGVELFVKVEGKGTPLLYIHGGPGSGSYWFEKFFGNFMEEHFTVVYLDQRGVGRSGSPENKDFSLQRMTQDFEEVREALGYSEWFTLGHSFGGLLQMGYAEYFPEAQKGMIMVNCTLYLNESFCSSWAPKASEFLGREYEGCEKDSLPLLQRMNKLGNELREKDLFWKMAYSNPESQEIMNATYADIENWNYAFGNAAWNFEDYWRNFLPQAKNVKIPVLFYYGTTDWMVGPDHYKQVKFPNMLLWKSEGGHIPFQENRGDLQKAILSYKNNFLF